MPNENDGSLEKQLAKILLELRKQVEIQGYISETERYVRILEILVKINSTSENILKELKYIQKIWILILTVIGIFVGLMSIILTILFF